MGVKACDVTGMHMSYHRLPWNFSHVTCHHGMVAQAKREQNKRCRQGVFHNIYDYDISSQDILCMY